MVEKPSDEGCYTGACPHHVLFFAWKSASPSGTITAVEQSGSYSSESNTGEGHQAALAVRKCPGIP